MANQNTNALMEAALEIAQERTEILNKLQAALEADNDSQALHFARVLCGLDDAQKGNRTHPSIN